MKLPPCDHDECPPTHCKNTMNPNDQVPEKPSPSPQEDATAERKGRYQQIIEGLHEQNEPAEFEGRKGFWIQPDCLFIENVDSPQAAIAAYRALTVAHSHNHFCGSILHAKANEERRALESRAVSAERELAEAKGKVRTLDLLRNTDHIGRACPDHRGMAGIAVDECHVCQHERIRKLKQERDSLAARLAEAEKPKERNCVQGQCVEIGDDENEQPRLVIHTTRESIMAHRGNLFLESVVVMLDDARRAEG